MNALRDADLATIADACRTLHHRGAVDAVALSAVLKDLLDHKPLTPEGLAAIFGLDVVAHLATQFTERDP